MQADRQTDKRIAIQHTFTIGKVNTETFCNVFFATAYCTIVQSISGLLRLIMLFTMKLYNYFITTDLCFRTLIVTRQSCRNLL